MINNNVVKFDERDLLKGEHIKTKGELYKERYL